MPTRKDLDLCHYSILLVGVYNILIYVYFTSNFIESVSKVLKTEVYLESESNVCQSKHT